MPTIFPTHTCFDDALEYLAARVAEDRRLARSHRLLLVHGLCLIPIGQPDEGQVFAHAWVEDANSCWTMGLLDGERVIVVRARDEFYANLRVQCATRYTVRQAWRENRRSGTYGPWLPIYQRQCRTHGSHPAADAVDPHGDSNTHGLSTRDE